jgi:hypothetical protein
MMLRALWIWQRWIAASLPKVARIAYADEVDGAVARHLGGGAQRFSEEEMPRCASQ